MSNVVKLNYIYFTFGAPWMQTAVAHRKEKNTTTVYVYWNFDIEYSQVWEYSVGSF
jgi:hypothetical protein